MSNWGVMDTRGRPGDAGFGDGAGSFGKPSGASRHDRRRVAVQSTMDVGRAWTQVTDGAAYNNVFNIEEQGAGEQWVNPLVVASFSELWQVFATMPIERITAQEPSEPNPDARQETVFQNRENEILRACRLKATQMPKDPANHGGYAALVDANHQDDSATKDGEYPPDSL